MENQQPQPQASGGQKSSLKVDAPEFIPSSFTAAAAVAPAVVPPVITAPQVAQQPNVGQNQGYQNGHLAANGNMYQAHQVGGYNYARQDQGRSNGYAHGGYGRQQYNSARQPRQQGHRYGSNTYDREASDFLTASDKQAMFFNGQFSGIEDQLFGETTHMKTGINFDKYDDIPVECSGENIPEPINTFSVQDDSASTLHRFLSENISRAKYLKPTPIQKYAIPISLNKRDIMACAQTGSGKTAAFLFPIIHHLMTERDVEDDNYPSGNGVDHSTPSALILAPTRELASQIFEEAVRFTYKSPVYCTVVYGGAAIQHQITQLTRKNCDICVATPGRLEDLRNRGIITFSGIRFFVLDEADRMLDMGFEPQIRRICEDFDMPSKFERTTSMFSATFPQEIQKLASDFLNNYIFVTVGRVGGAAKNVKQSFIYIQDDNFALKRSALLQIIQNSTQQSMAASGEKGLKLVFVETKRKCDQLCEELKRHFGIRCVSIHGDRSQNQREKALFQFASKRVEVMIATDVASRGLDIPNVHHVINFDIPNDIDSYVHRIGRTGRAGNKGLATAIMSPSDAKVARPLMKVLSDAEQDIPSWMSSLANSNYASKTYGNKNRSNNKFGARDYRSQYSNMGSNFSRGQAMTAQMQYAQAYGGMQQLSAAQFTMMSQQIAGNNRNAFPQQQMNGYSAPMDPVAQQQYAAKFATFGQNQGKQW